MNRNLNLNLSVSFGTYLRRLRGQSVYEKAQEALGEIRRLRKSIDKMCGKVPKLKEGANCAITHELTIQARQLCRVILW